jgi:hypothetical protein
MDGLGGKDRNWGVLLKVAGDQRKTLPMGGSAQLNRSVFLCSSTGERFGRLKPVPELASLEVPWEGWGLSGGWS